MREDGPLDALGVQSFVSVVVIAQAPVYTTATLPLATQLATTRRALLRVPIRR